MVDIAAWCKRVLGDGGGLRSYQKHERGGERPSNQRIAEWVIRCLANPGCEGSEAVLLAILEQRKMKDASK